MTRSVTHKTQQSDHMRSDTVKAGVRAVLTKIAEAKEADANQLSALRSEINKLTSPISEAEWDKHLKAEVKSCMKGYTNGARDVMVNRLKAASIGLSLAKTDKTFEPSADVSRNLARYAAEVKPLLQAAGHLRTIKRSVSARPVADRAMYWLIGCEDAAGVSKANAIIGGGPDVESCKAQAQKDRRKWAKFFIVKAKMEELSLAGEPVSIRAHPLTVVNSAVVATTYRAAA